MKGSPSGVNTSQIRRAVRVAIRLPGDDGKGVQVGHEVHVALADARKALDRRAVEPDAVLEQVADLADRDGHALDHAHDVGELQVDKAHASLANDAQDGFFVHLGHVLDDPFLTKAWDDMLFATLAKAA